MKNIRILTSKGMCYPCIAGSKRDIHCKCISMVVLHHLFELPVCLNANCERCVVLLHDVDVQLSMLLVFED